jgi:nucleoside-diphosphate-sugar epimerase
MKNNQSILITGSEGLIGGILYKTLKEKYSLFTFDKREGENVDNRHFTGDIGDMFDIEKVFQYQTYDFIIHLAADAAPNATWESVLNSNINGTRNIYELSSSYGVKRIIFASSNRVIEGYYGDKKKKTISLSDAVCPVNYYGVSKVFGEVIAKMFFDAQGLSSICLRIGSVIPSDNPKDLGARAHRWLSHRDLIQIVERSLKTDTNFGVYFAVSENNIEPSLDLSHARADLKYSPIDSAQDLL